MILRFAPTSTSVEREAVVAALAAQGIDSTPRDGALLLHDEIPAEDVLVLAAMPGVAEIAAARDGTSTRGESILLWFAGAAAILGVLVILACNTGTALGQRADPLRTPGALRPSWPLLPWYAAVDLAPSMVPVSTLLLVAAIALFAWPTVGRAFAEKRPGLHAALGVAVLLFVAALAVMEVTR
jgi:hypothetical protein